MRRLEVPVGSRDAGLHRQIEAPDHLPGREVVGDHRMLIRQLRVEALLVRGELPGANGVVEPYPVDGSPTCLRRRSSAGTDSPASPSVAERRPDAGGRRAGRCWCCRAGGHLARPCCRADRRRSPDARDLARGGRNLVDPVVQERRHEQAPPVRRERHVVGAPRVQRPVPQQAALAMSNAATSPT